LDALEKDGAEVAWVELEGRWAYAHGKGGCKCDCEGSALRM
jgi:hypothetical protein